MATPIRHTFELDSVKEACTDLIAQNAEHLISYIYANQHVTPYNDPTIRVGLSIKTLLKSPDSAESVIVNSEVINPVMEDLTGLINASKNEVEKEALMAELTFLQRCTQLDELVSLNTVQRQYQQQ